MKTKKIEIELYSKKKNNGTVDYWLITKNSQGVVIKELYSSIDGAKKRMRSYLSASSQFRSDWHRSIKIVIEKEFLL